MKRRLVSPYNLLVILKLIESIQKDEKTSKKKRRYNMIYAYYAVMGSFTVDISHLHEKLSRATITTNGILFLAKHGHFLQITVDSIKDKSKADVLAKGLVCVQVLWVVGQTIERKAAGYPITLLEVHTIVHVVCALVLYALWFRKPQDVHDPTVVPARDFEDALPFMVLCSSFKSHSEYNLTHERAYKMNDEIHFTEPKDIPGRSPDWAWSRNLDWIPKPVDPVTAYGPSAQAWSRRVELPADQQRSGQVVTHYKYVKFTPAGDPPPKTVLTINSGQALASGLGPRELYLRDVGDRFGTSHRVSVTLSQKTSKRLEKAGVFLKSNVRSDSGYYRIPLTELTNKVPGYHKRMLCFREANLRNTFIDYLDKSGHQYLLFLLPAAMILTIPTAYGCVHLEALSIIFPTPIERLLWKIACYVLIGPAAFIGGCTLCRAAYHILKPYNDENFLFASFEKIVCFSYKCASKFSDWVDNNDHLFSVVFIFIPGAFGAVYIAARLYIVIEAFIALRHVPIGVYQTPPINFMDYIPHI